MPRVFLSHSAKDRAFVEGELLPLLRAHGVDTWYAPDDISTAQEWERRIREGLQTCDWFLIVLSPRSAASPWVQAELHWAVNQRWGRVVPVMLEPCDPMTFHLRLQLLQYVDFSQPGARTKLLATWGIEPGGVPATAAQFIYTRLEAEFSPTRSRGFQVAYVTPTLPDQVVRHVQLLVGDYRRPPQDGSPRLQFFIAPSGQAVVARTVPTNDRAIQDRTGRGGLFLAHGLVLEPEEFARAGNNPFALVDATPFLDSPAEMIERFGSGTGVAPPLTLHVGPEPKPDAESWDAAELARLLGLAGRAEEMRSRGEHVALTCTPREGLAALRLLFSRLSVDRRRACTFDTFREEPHAGDFWLVARPRRADESPRSVVAVHTRPAAKGAVHRPPAGGPHEPNAARPAPPPVRPPPRDARHQPAPAPQQPAPPVRRSWLRRLLPRRPNATCPSCLSRMRLGAGPAACPTCGEPLPPELAALLGSARLFPMQVLGFTAHGKTVFLYAMTQALERLPAVWPRFVSYPVTDRSLAFLRALRVRYAQGHRPDATTVARQELYLLMLEGLERWNPSLLALRDVAGEYFTNLRYPTDSLPFLLQAPVVYLLISRPDFIESPGLAADDLLNGYIHTLASHSINVRRSPRRAVVVFTKGDLITDLPAPLRDYLLADPLRGPPHNGGESWDAARTAAYLTEMAQADTLIRNWVGRDFAGRRLLHVAERHNIPLRFSVVAAPGMDGRVGSPSIEPDAYRILDPFFWGLELLSG